MDLPTDWKITSVSGNTAKILTDYKPYQVYLILSLNKGNNIKIIDLIGDNIFTTKYGKVFTTKNFIEGSTGAIIGKNDYTFDWNIESNQPAPENLPKTWVPDSNVTPDTILNITKTIKPSTQVIDDINSDQVWETYTSTTLGLSFSHPESLIFNTRISLGTPLIYANNNLFINPYNRTIDLGGRLPFFSVLGFTKKNNEVYATVATSITDETESFLIDNKDIEKSYTNQNGVEIVILKNLEPYLFFPPTRGNSTIIEKSDSSNMGAIINTKNKYTVTIRGNKEISQSDFIKILDTVKFY